MHTVVRAVGRREDSSDSIGGLIGAAAMVYFGLAVGLFAAQVNSQSDSHDHR